MTTEEKKNSNTHFYMFASLAGRFVFREIPQITLIYTFFPLPALEKSKWQRVYPRKIISENLLFLFQLFCYVGLGSGQTPPPKGCAPCQDVLEGPLNGTYVLDELADLCGEFDGCTYINNEGQTFCIQKDGLYDTVGCAKEVVEEFSIWTSTATVPDKLGRVPDEPLGLSFGSVQVFPGKRYDTDKLQVRPEISFAADPNALYTLLIEDNDISSPPIKFAHWFVTNIPGTNVSAGTEVVDYLPSFYFHEAEDGKSISTNLTDSNRHLVLVYKQPGRINVTKTQFGCTPDLIGSRVVDHDRLQQEYNLEGPVAGSFYRVGYSQFGRTEEMLCFFSKCTGAYFPFEIEGVNNGADCLPSNSTK